MTKDTEEMIRERMSEIVNEIDNQQTHLNNIDDEEIRDICRARIAGLNTEYAKLDEML